MTNPRHNMRDVFPDTGTDISAKSWLTEAPMRMLMNNLHPDVAENPHELVVYGGIGRAARTWDDFDKMVSTLKIDRAFVVDVATDPVDRKIVTAIVALADSMGMETVAEGVEEAAQVAILRDLGITLFQGFYFHRPIAPDGITGLLQLDPS